jgi:hypothetical protein
MQNGTERHRTAQSGPRERRGQTAENVEATETEPRDYRESKNIEHRA